MSEPARGRSSAADLAVSLFDAERKDSVPRARCSIATGWGQRGVGELLIDLVLLDPAERRDLANALGPPGPRPLGAVGADGARRGGGPAGVQGAGVSGEHDYRDACAAPRCGQLAASETVWVGSLERMTTPERMIETVTAEYGHHAGRRALHAKGTFARGRFTATPAARALTRAAHMQGEPVDVLLRFSTGGGNPGVPDSAPGVRGLGASFSLPDGTVTDVVCQTAPRFPVRTPEAFEALMKANTHDRSRLWKMPLFLAQHPSVIPTLKPNVDSFKPPVGYTTLPYFGIHAFRWLDADGGSRFVRYTLLPEGGDQRLSAAEAKERGREYLEEDLVERLRSGPARFTLQVQIADAGDPTSDSSAQWPANRERVDVGTLEVIEVIPDPEAGDHIHVFDPTRVTDGIELSDDPILAYRREAYSVSAYRRLGDQRM